MSFRLYQKSSQEVEVINSSEFQTKTNLKPHIIIKHNTKRNKINDIQRIEKIEKVRNGIINYYMKNIS